MKWNWNEPEGMAKCIDFWGEECILRSIFWLRKSTIKNKFIDVFRMHIFIIKLGPCNNVACYMMGLFCNAILARINKINKNKKESLPKSTCSTSMVIFSLK